MGYVFAKNDEISLVLPDWHDGPEEFYEIILNKTNEAVGNICYRYETSKTLGNVHYNVFEEYRGNNYAKKALKLLSENIHRLDDKDILIAIIPDDVSYLKTAVGAGAKFMKRANIPKGSNLSQGGKYVDVDIYMIKNTEGKNK